MSRSLNSVACAVALAASLVLAAPAAAQTKARGLEVSGLPALNFDADEGFGYGLILALYGYDPGNVTYRWTVQPTVFLTTQGRRDYTLFFDAPSSREHPWRVTAYAGREQQLAAPYYGLGNATPYDSSLEHGSTRYFYRYGRDRTRLTTDVQHALWHPSVRALDRRRRLHRQDRSHALRQRNNAICSAISPTAPRNRATRIFFAPGLTWDTRDREIGTLSGTWADVLVQRVDKKLGASTQLYAMDGGRATLPANWRTPDAGQPPARAEHDSRRAVLRTRRNPNDAEATRRTRRIEQRARNSKRPIHRPGNRSSRTTSFDGGRPSSICTAGHRRSCSVVCRRGSRLGKWHRPF